MLIPLTDQVGTGVKSGPIPGVVYQTGSTTSLGKKHHAEVSRFREVNKDMDFKFFGDEEQFDYMHQSWRNHPILKAYRLAKWPQMRADIFRYCILYENGGWYCDINKGIFLRLSSLMTQGEELITSCERNELTLFPDISVSGQLQHPQLFSIQWAFAASKGSPFLERLIDDVAALYVELREVKFYSVKQGVLMATGPGAFNRSLRAYLQNGPLVSWRQVGVDFDGKGRYRLEGSEGTRSMRARHYSLARSDFVYRVGPE